VTFLRSLVDDLIEKRLWPFAVALVVALVAIPVVLGRGGSAAPAAPSPVASAASAGQPASGQTALVNVDPSLGEGRVPDGKVRNPFKQQHVPSAITATSTATAPSSSGGAGSSTAGGTASTGGSDAGSGTSSTPAPDAGTPSTPSTDKLESKPKTDPRDTYRVSLRFGEAGNQRTIKDIARLTPLPSSTDPFFVFLGVLGDGKTAVFMVSSDAAPTGDGACRPKLTNCETIQLKAGESEFFDLATGTAGVVQYQLDMLSVSKRRAETAKAAAARHARESKAGRIILRAAVAEKDPGYRYVASFGVLRESDLKTAVEAHVPAGALGSAAAVDGDEGAALPPAAAPAG
jgi:hypothetical protein